MSILALALCWQSSYRTKYMATNESSFSYTTCQQCVLLPGILGNILGLELGKQVATVNGSVLVFFAHLVWITTMPWNTSRVSNPGPVIEGSDSLLLTVDTRWVSKPWGQIYHTWKRSLLLCQGIKQAAKSEAQEAACKHLLEFLGLTRAERFVRGEIPSVEGPIFTLSGTGPFVNCSLSALKHCVTLFLMLYLSFANVPSCEN